MKQQQSARHVANATGNTRDTLFTGWKHGFGMRIVLFICMAVLFYVSISDKILPETYDIEPGTISESTILAPKQILNESATRKAEDEAAEKVQPVYAVVPMQNVQLLTVLFDKLEQINSDVSFSMIERTELFPRVFPSEYEEFYDKKIN